MVTNNNLPREMSLEYVKMPTPNINNLTPHEILKLRLLLKNSDCHLLDEEDDDDESYYPEFGESTHAWMVFADNPTKRIDRLIGTVIFIFQLFTYWLFAAEAIEDYQRGAVAVLTTHSHCIDTNQVPEGDFLCESEVTNKLDAIVAFGMIAIFLASDIQQAFRAVTNTQSRTALAFACLVVVEIIGAFLSASISISQKLYIGEVTDAVEAGVGLLFIRELSTRAYHGIRQRNSTNKAKSYIPFFTTVIATVCIGLLVHPFCEAMFAP